MAGDNSVEEIIRKVVNAARTLDSYDLSTVRVTDRDGRKSEVRGRQIRVGNDYYRLFPSIVRRSERLDYRGREYVRQSPEDTWRTPEDSGRWVTAQIVEVENPPDWDEAFYSPNYGIDFNPFRDGERLPDELVQGRKAIRVSFSETIAVSVPTFGAMEKHLPPMDAESRLRFQEMLGEKLAQQPDSLMVRHILWIDADTFALAKVGLEGVSSRAGRIVESFVETQVYSRLNEAELPGPLPE